MEMLNAFGMLLSSDLWAKILNLFAKWIVNYGWAIVVFTIVLKLVLSPLDIFQRYSSTKQQRVMAYMQPEINAINEKYAGNKERINAETQKVYKKYNNGLGGSCIIMLVSMVVSMIVFFTLFSSIRSYGNEKLYESYQHLDNSYVVAEQEYDKLDSSLQAEQTKEEYAIKVTKEEYEKLRKKISWLWVKNVWKPDKNNSQFVSVKDYIKHLNIKQDSEEAQAITERYNAITSAIVGKDKDVNGYYILIVVCVLVSFLAQFISAKMTQQKGQKLNKMNIIMMIFMPVVMISFAWSSNAVFTLYMITNSIMTTLLSAIISLIMRKTGKKDVNILLKKKNVEVVEYSRNYKK